VVHAQVDGEYDIILRPRIKWDVAQMRKYFHGPVRDFIVCQFKELGLIYTKTQVKDYLKGKFGLIDERGFAESTATYDFKTYTEFLNNINFWCIETFECELPVAEQVE